MDQIQALIISGYGINCEREMAFACEEAGARATIVHAKKLLNNEVSLDSYHLLCFPGGFSFGDELGAAKAFANRLTYSSKLKEQILDFVEKGKCVIGICNGFQLLVKLGLLPGLKETSASLATNDSCQFENRWAHHKVLPSPCVFTRGIEKLYLPIRHGEGKFVLENPEIAQQLFANNQIVLQYSTTEGEPTQNYPENPNGSIEAIAGICDPTGRILGMMAHPEAALLATHHPHWHRQMVQARREKSTLPKYGPGYPFFENVVQYLKEKSCQPIM